MNTVTFKSVYEAILRRLGVDPLGDAVTQDTSRSIAEHVTERARTAWGTYDWPELARTEERAYRQVWNGGTQYRRANEDGLPDEVYYIPSAAYFRVKSDAMADPPVGTLPTDAASFDLMVEPFTHYVARDQNGKRSMGPVLNVYGTNPSLNGCCSTGCLQFRPSEKGITICHGPATTVFLQFWTEPSEFTFVPFVLDKAYSRGDLVYYDTDGNCYKCTADNTGQLPTDTDFWVLQPVPSIFAPYLKAGAYSDCLKEMPVASDQGQIRLTAVSNARNEAEELLGHEVDDLLKQGHKHHWMHRRYARVNWRYDGTLWWATTGWCCSEPWSGNIVYLLTDETLGSTDTEVCDTTYHPEITAILTADGTPSLEGLATTTRRTTCTLIQIAVTVDAAAEAQSWRLDAGTADPDDEGQVQPEDFDADNPKFWQKVGG
jgi:hypothetical protein